MNDDQRRFISPGRPGRLKVIGVVLFVLALTLSCKLIETPVDKAIDAVDRLSALLERNSDDWEAVADRVLDELPIEARSLIDHEVNNVIQRGIAASGVEFRCDVDFVRKRVRDDLYRLKAELLQRKGVHVQAPARSLPVRSAPAPGRYPGQVEPARLGGDGDRLVVLAMGGKVWACICTW